MIRKTKELNEDEERNPGRISFEEEKEEGEDPNINKIKK